MEPKDFLQQVGPPCKDAIESAASLALPEESLRNRWGCLTLLALIALIVLPIWLLLYFAHGVFGRILAGGVTWAVSVLIKGPLAAALNGQSERRVAAGQGLLSAATELGVAAWYFYVWPFRELVEVVAFGCGAGCSETLYVIVQGVVAGARGVVEEKEAEWAAGAAVSLCVRHASAIERAVTLLGHIGSRGLIALAVAAAFPRNLLPLLTSLLLFTLVDGLAYYSALQQWDWNRPCLCRRFYGFLFGISLLEIGLFRLFTAIL